MNQTMHDLIPNRRGHDLFAALLLLIMLHLECSSTQEECQIEKHFEHLIAESAANATAIASHDRVLYLRSSSGRPTPEHAIEGARILHASGAANWRDPR